MFNGDRISVWEDEEVLEVDSGDGYTALWMYLMPLNCTLKNGYSGYVSTYIRYIYFATGRKDRASREHWCNCHHILIRFLRM